MRLDITDEVRLIAERMNRDPACQANPALIPADVQGAVWAMVQLTGYTQTQVEQMIAQARGNTPTSGPMLGVSPPAPAVQAPPAAAVPLHPGALMQPAISPDEIVGTYPLADGSSWPITKLAEPLQAADLSKPPAPETTDSMAQAQRNGKEWGLEAYEPMDPELLAEVEREMEEARQRGTEYPDEPTIQVERPIR